MDAKRLLAAALLIASLGACGLPSMNNQQAEPTPNATVEITTEPTATATATKTTAATPKATSGGLLKIVVPKNLQTPPGERMQPSYIQAGPRTDGVTGLDCQTNSAVNIRLSHWYGYEVPLDAPDIGEHQQVCRPVIAICQDLQTHHSANHALQMVQNQYGFSSQSAPAVFKAAIMVGCPQNFTGKFSTRLDQNATAFMADLPRNVIWRGATGQLSVTDYGIFLKQACSRNPDELQDALTAPSSQGDNLSRMYLSQVGNYYKNPKGSLEAIAFRAVNTGCPTRATAIGNNWK